MAALDLSDLNQKLDFQNQDYWLHLQADTSLSKYPAKQHARAVAIKLGVDHGLLYLAGEEATFLKDSDQLVPFRQRRYFYYLTGCNESDCHVTYDIAQDLLTLYIPKVDLRHAVWGGAGSTKTEAYAKYDVDVVAYSTELRGILDCFLESHQSAKIYTQDLLDAPDLPACGPLSSAQGVNDSRRQPWWIYPSSKIDSSQLKSAIELCRVIKFPHEIQLIRRANEISAKAHLAVLENIRHFNHERQVEGLFLDTCISAGAHNQAYSIIAGAGTNAAVLHYVANNAPFGDSQVLLLDAGAEYDCYASDVTRTFPISGEWSAEAKNIYDAVNDMQAQCIARIAPGVHFRDLQILAVVIAVRWLLKLGILHNGTLEEILRAGTIYAFFPHGLGHHVGLEVHDVLHVPIQSKDAEAATVNMSIFKDAAVAGLSAADLTKVYHDLLAEIKCLSPVTRDSPSLEPGMVVTVEPGLYFSDFALSKVYLRDPNHAKYINKEVLLKYMPVGGVRIEDDILVTKDGYENLTTAPKGDEALRIIRGEPEMQTSSAISEPMSRGIPSAAKGKAPLHTFNRASESSSVDPEPALNYSSLHAELATKCSIAVKQTSVNSLPPPTDTSSLLSSFPFGRNTASNASEVPALPSTSPPIASRNENYGAMETARVLSFVQTWLLDRDMQASQICYEIGGTRHHEKAVQTILEDLCRQGLIGRGHSNQHYCAVPPHGHVASANEIPAKPSSETRRCSIVDYPLRQATSSSTTDASHFIRAVYDFDEPADRGTLSFHKGDIMQVMNRSENGWLDVVMEVEGQRGWIPENYVERYTPPVASLPAPLDAGPPSSSHIVPTGEHGRVCITQIRNQMARNHLLSVLTSEMQQLLQKSPMDISTLKHLVSERLGKADGPECCFSGLCMHLRASDVAFNFSQIEGQGVDKFKSMFEVFDRALRKEFEPFHVFHRMVKEERERLLERRWSTIGIKEQGADLGICGTCLACREGFLHWDEKWLLDDVMEVDGEEDD